MNGTEQQAELVQLRQALDDAHLVIGRQTVALARMEQQLVQIGQQLAALEVEKPEVPPNRAARRSRTK